RRRSSGSPVTTTSAQGTITPVRSVARGSSSIPRPGRQTFGVLKPSPQAPSISMRSGRGNAPVIARVEIRRSTQSFRTAPVFHDVKGDRARVVTGGTAMTRLRSSWKGKLLASGLAAALLAGLAARAVEPGKGNENGAGDALGRAREIIGALQQL